jgi:hypothetical protein
MKERPILFSAPMVRAILAGTKTQTRRIVKKTEAVSFDEDGRLSFLPCPYGQPRDLLYVREGFSYTHDCTKDDVGAPVWYWADGNPDHGDFTRPKPSIHMPRWASRIMLEIISVRVQKLQNISEADSRAEGIIDGGCLNCGNPEPCGCDNPAPDARDSFCRLWQSINGELSWHENPWVWVVEFKRIG